MPDATAILSAANRGVPDKDAPILAAALVAKVDILVTGDRVHFGHLSSKFTDGVRVLRLSDSVERLFEDK